VTNLRPSARSRSKSDRYFIVPPGAEKDGIIVLDGSEFHHCIRVSRVRAGETVKLLDGRGGTYEARLLRIAPREAVLEVVSFHRTDEPPPVDIAIGIIKSHRLDLAVEKCTELGVRGLIPFSSERSVWRAEEAGSEGKIERIRRKMIASCKQSGQSRFPQIDAPVRFEILAQRVSSYEAVFLADQGGTAVEMPIIPGPAGHVLGIVGPEGGLTPGERNTLVAKGAVPVSLGPFRLRSETAAICLSCRLLTGIARSAAR
jgi:16S rRNA (uracil1498-N3)-methyltransferase